MGIVRQKVNMAWQSEIQHLMAAFSAERCSNLFDLLNNSLMVNMCQESLAPQPGYPAV